MKRGAGNVFDAFHQFYEPSLFTGTHWREADATVADDHSGHTMTRRRVKDRIPCGLTVVMSVNVNKARRYDEPGCVDDFGGVSDDRLAHLNDNPVGNCDISDKTRGTGSIDNGSVDDFQIEHAPTLGPDSHLTQDFLPRTTLAPTETSFRTL